MRKFAAAFVVALAIAGTTAVAAQADDPPPIDTTSPFVMCSPDVCSFTLVPPPELRVDGFFDGDGAILNDGGFS